MKTGTPPSADAVRLKMASLCARSEQCESDIRAKIRRRGLSAVQENEIIDFLKEERFLDNDRFAGAFASDKMRFSGWGRLKIRMALYAKGISTEIIKRALDNLPEDAYFESLLEAARSKSRSLDVSKREDVVKLYRFLASRGFESDYCMKALRILRTEKTRKGVNDNRDEEKGGFS